MKSSILSELLSSKHLKSKDDLTSAERISYEQWERILDTDIDVEMIVSAIRGESKRLTEEWLAEDNKNPFNYLFHWKNDIEIKARIKNYNNLLKVIDNKTKEKEKLVSYIKNLIKNKN